MSTAVNVAKAIDDQRDLLLPNGEPVVNRLESLGDNCEFGFVLRSLGYETGSLFRWTVTPIDNLHIFLENNQAIAYERDSLVPFAPGMIKDEKSGISFHSKMRSERGDDGKLTFLLTEEEMDDIYQKDKSKVDHLSAKFFHRLADKDATVYVLKKNGNLDDRHLLKTAELLKKYNEKHVLLAVHEGCDAVQAGTIEEIESGVFRAHITAFAPYVNAKEIQYNEWTSILHSVSCEKSITERLC